MGVLIYSAITSLDGYVADEAGNFEWAAPDEQVHAAVNELVGRAGIQLYGRRMYDVLAAWETIDAGPDVPAVVRDFAAIWRAADKVVYSTTLDVARSARTRIERRVDPDAVRAMRDTAERDLTIGGPRLAGEALRHGLVTSITCSSTPSSSAAAPRGCRRPCGGASSWSNPAGSTTASCTCTTGHNRERGWAGE